jgi:hypothetical protein
MMIRASEPPMKYRRSTILRFLACEAILHLLSDFPAEC